MTILYKNAHVCDAHQEFDGYVAVQDGIITYAGTDDPNITADKVEDIEGKVLLPALIDLHTHLRDPGFPEKETIETGLQAALHGGYAMLCAMANTKPVITTPELVEANHKKAHELRLCRLMQAAAAGIDLKDETPTDYEALSKVTRIITNDGNTIFSDEFMENLLKESTKHGFIISTHCQPERKTVERDIALLEKVGGNLHVGHISHRDTLRMISEAKLRGTKITCEVMPHHLVGYDNPYRVNPPMRAKEDVEALIEGCRSGMIDCLATDHAPHTPENKAAGMAGISNIDYALPLFWRVFYENGIPMQRLAEMSSYTPAVILGEKAGLIKEGYRADITVFDPEPEYPLDINMMRSRSRNTPFEGIALKGRVLKTIIEGEVRYAYN